MLKRAYYTPLLFSLSAAPLHAADYYVSGSYGINEQEDSNNNGSFTSGFTTGTVTGVNLPLLIPAGAPVNWKTQFNDGDSFTLEVGRNFGRVRAEIEYDYADADVESHRGVSAAGIDLTAIDAKVSSSLLPAKLDIEVESMVGDIGLRYHF